MGPPRSDGLVAGARAMALWTRVPRLVIGLDTESVELGDSLSFSVVSGRGPP